MGRLSEIDINKESWKLKLKKDKDAIAPCLKKREWRGVGVADYCSACLFLFHIKKKKKKKGVGGGGGITFDLGKIPCLKK